MTNLSYIDALSYGRKVRIGYLVVTAALALVTGCATAPSEPGESPTPTPVPAHTTPLPDVPDPESSPSPTPRNVTPKPSLPTNFPTGGPNTPPAPY